MFVGGGGVYCKPCCVKFRNPRSVTAARREGHASTIGVKWEKETLSHSVPNEFMEARSISERDPEIGGTQSELRVTSL